MTGGPTFRAGSLPRFSVDLPDRKLTTMALATLSFQHDEWYEGTRDGVPIYDGSASGFHNWIFRTEVKWTAAKKEDRPSVMSKIIEGLRGDAQNKAKDIGVTDLLADDGYKELTEALRKSIFPKKLAEAKVLYQQGHKMKGGLSRQPSEPMVNYISRRTRWWKQLVELDPDIGLSETIRGELLLESAGLNRNEQLMVLTSANNVRTFEAISAAVIDQHSHTHLDERSRRTPYGGDRGSRSGKSRYYEGRDKKYSRGRGFGRGSDRHRRQYPKRGTYVDIADDTLPGSDESDDHANDGPSSENSSDESETHAYYSVARTHDHEDDAAEGPEVETMEDVQLVVFTAMQQDGYENEDIANVAQMESICFLGWNKDKGRSRGRSSSAGSKRKGKSKDEGYKSRFSNCGNSSSKSSQKGRRPWRD